MKRGKEHLQFWNMMGMELSWRYAWANFLTISIWQQPFPFLEAIVTFALAAAITFLSKGRGWRIIYILSSQGVGFLLAGLRMVYLFNSWYYPTVRTGSFVWHFDLPKGPLEWIHLILLLCLILMFWIGGVTFVRRAKTYTVFCSRFDLGMAAFTVLFLTKFLVLYKGGVRISDSWSLVFFLAFFIFSLLGIGLARGEAKSPKNFLPGYRKLGVILSFTLVVTLFGTGLLLFFLPFLTLAAEKGYGLIKTAAEPFGPVLVSILRYIFMGRALRIESSSSPAEGETGELMIPREYSWWMELFEKILIWVLGSLWVLFIVVISCAALFFLIRWLLSRTPSAPGGESLAHFFSLCLRKLRIFLASLWKWMIHRRKDHLAAIQLFAALRIWGRRCGLPHVLSETAIEYGLRLKKRFPSLAEEIESIIVAFNKEVYAEATLTEGEMAEAKSAWRKLRSPRHWPSRLKTWFFQS